jgi:hypothetical protein
MTDGSSPNFSSSLIAHEYLSHAAPETVYAWLKANAGELDGMYMSPFSDELLKALLGRNDPIINIGVASVATEKEILRTLWKSGNQAVRNAIAGNPYRGAGFWHILSPHDWADAEELTSALQDGDTDFIKLWCTNPALDFNGLKQTFAKEGIYEGISDDRWLITVYWALQNPKLTVRDDRHHEGTDFPTYRAAWSLLLMLSNNRTNAYILCERFSKLNTFIAPYESLLEEEAANILTDREKWNQQQREGNILFLRHVFERWTASASADPNARDKDGNEAHEFQTLRQDVAAAVANRGGEIQNFIKDHSDVYVRRGYYRGGRFNNAAELRTAFEKDGKDFLEAAIYNENLYASYPKGVRPAFRGLVEENPRYEDYPVPSFTRIWDHQATQLFKRDPVRHPDPNIFEESPPEPDPSNSVGQQFVSKARRVARNTGRWAWRIAENVFYAAVVWYVLSRLRGHPENVIVPILGLIYVALRTGGVSLAQITLQHALALDSIQQKLRTMSDASYVRDRDEIQAIEQMKHRLTGDIGIESISLCAIGAICVWFLFTAL